MSVSGPLAEARSVTKSDGGAVLSLTVSVMETAANPTINAITTIGQRPILAYDERIPINPFQDFTMLRERSGSIQG
jgi:hypothetical protein